MALDAKHVVGMEQWVAEGIQLFGEDKSKWKFICPNCGNIQTGEDFRKIHVDPSGKVYFSCIGRFMTHGEVGDIGDKISPCNYTLGGLLVFTNTFITNDGDEEPTPVFEFYG